MVSSSSSRGRLDLIELYDVEGCVCVSLWDVYASFTQLLSPGMGTQYKVCLSNVTLRSDSNFNSSLG